MQQISLSFVDEEISAWGGIAILKKMLDKVHFSEALSGCSLPLQGSNRGYNPVQIIYQFMASVWCGANRYQHLEVMRFDPVVKKIFGWERMAGQRAFVRFFNKFDMEISQRVFHHLHRHVFDNLIFDNYTLDIDSSVLTRNGGQEGAARGYNPRKPGRKSHHPIMAFVADLDMVANFWLRSGDAHTSNNFEAFLEDSLSNLGDKKVGLLRLDSGFYSKSIFEYIENHQRVSNYIVAVPMYVTIQRELLKQRAWNCLDQGIEVAESLYQSPNWDKPRRLVMVRKLVEKHPDTPGKMLSLFDDTDVINNYRYSCYITDLTLPAAEVWRLYRGRANAENRIKELKYDYGLDKINQQSFDGTEASLHFIMLAHNILNLFKKVIINERVKQRLSSLRHKMLAIPSYLKDIDNKLILNMALQMNRRQWIASLWNRLDDYNFKPG